MTSLPRSSVKWSQRNLMITHKSRIRINMILRTRKTIIRATFLRRDLPLLEKIVPITMIRLLSLSLTSLLTSENQSKCIIRSKHESWRRESCQREESKWIENNISIRVLLIRGCETLLKEKFFLMWRNQNQKLRLKLNDHIIEGLFHKELRTLSQNFYFLKASLRGLLHRLQFPQRHTMNPIK